MNRTRLQWLDALRGFTMLMVVTNHVYGMGFVADTKQSMFMSLCLLFRMPLFFFISGFLAYKAHFEWNSTETGRLIAKKLRVQVVPTLVFMTAFVALTYKARYFWEKLGEAWQSATKDGYWFTLVLLQMFLVYYALCGICSLWKRSEKGARASRVTLTDGSLIFLFILSLCAYATLYMPSWFSWQKDEFWQVTSLTEFVRFFHFFLFGNLVHRFWPQVQKLFDSTWFFPLLIALAFVCAGDYLKWHHLRLQWANLPRTVSMYALVMIIVAFFRNYSRWFSKETRLGATLQYMGVRTLDIYLLHYFFLPKLPDVGKWFKAHPQNFMLEGTSAIAVALLVVAFCILTSHILRVSPFLKKWLFGRENTSLTLNT
ncbi:MAG: acyltransferase [Bacteroidaceae bacterium]|nr:acyltransferase [Bacteroidaceae bacterium]